MMRRGKGRGDLVGRAHMDVAMAGAKRIRRWEGGHVS